MLYSRILRLTSVAIALIILLSQLPALAAQPGRNTNIQLTESANYVERNIMLMGEGGHAVYLRQASQIETSSLLLMSKVHVEGSAVKGVGNLVFEGNAKEGSRVKVKLDYGIVGVEGFTLACNNNFLDAPCRTGMIPFAYTGMGTFSISIGSSESKQKVIVVVDASDTIGRSSGTLNVAVLDSQYQPIMKFSVNLSEYLEYN